MVRFYTYLEMYLNDINRRTTLSEFESHFKIPHQTIKKHLKQFTDAKILKEEKGKRFLFYTLNKEHPLTREYLILCEKERLFNFLQKNVLFSRLYNELSSFFKSAKILVFGSAAERKDFADIDLLVLSKDENIKTIVKQFQETYTTKIHLVQTNEKYLTKTFIQEIRKKHVIFNNHEYFVGVLYQ